MQQSSVLWLAALIGGWLESWQRVLSWLAGTPQYSELWQDYNGAHALLHHGTAYTAMSVAGILRCEGLCAVTTTTHPPSAFVFLLPLSPLPFGVVSSLWMVLSVAVTLAALWLYGMRRSLLWVAPLLLLSPTFLTSLDQLTPIWLLGLALAWRFRERPIVAGACVGLASLPKFTAAIALLPFLRDRQWPALVGFSSVWGVALGLIVLLNAGIVPEYLRQNRTVSLVTIARPDNSAFLPALHRLAGASGVLAGVTLLLLVFLVAWQRPLNRKTWALWSWLGVACLPIAWTYSLLPLLPGLLIGLSASGWRRAVAVSVLLLLALAPLPTVLPGLVTACLALVVVPLLADGLRLGAPGRVYGTNSPHQNVMVPPEKASILSDPPEFWAQ